MSDGQYYKTLFKYLFFFCWNGFALPNLHIKEKVEHSQASSPPAKDSNFHCFQGFAWVFKKFWNSLATAMHSSIM